MLVKQAVMHRGAMENYCRKTVRFYFETDKNNAIRNKMKVKTAQAGAAVRKEEALFLRLTA